MPYTCSLCATQRFLIFPRYDESVVVCSPCYRITNEKLEEQGLSTIEYWYAVACTPGANRRFVF